jgi:hypothetical protein
LLPEKFDKLKFRKKTESNCKRAIAGDPLSNFTSVITVLVTDLSYMLVHLIKIGFYRNLYAENMKF